MNFEFMDMRTKSPNRKKMLNYDGFTIEKYTFVSGISTWNIYNKLNIINML